MKDALEEMYQLMREEQVETLNALKQFNSHLAYSQPLLPPPRPPKPRKWIKIFTEGRYFDVLFRSIHEREEKWWSIAYRLEPRNMRETWTITGGHPRLMMEIIKELRWARQWLLDRLEGYQRAQQELLRQQKKWVEQAQAELTLHQLKEVQL